MTILTNNPDCPHEHLQHRPASCWPGLDVTVCLDCGGVVSTKDSTLQALALLQNQDSGLPPELQRFLTTYVPDEDRDTCLLALKVALTEGEDGFNTPEREAALNTLVAAIERAAAHAAD